MHINVLFSKIHRFHYIEAVKSILPPLFSNEFRISAVLVNEGQREWNPGRWAHSSKQFRHGCLRDRDRDAQGQPAESSGALERAIAGDSAAFEQLVLPYERRILTLGWRLLGTLDDAKDAAQEVFLRAFKYPECRDIATQLFDSLSVFKTFRGYEIDGPDLADVRQRVRRELIGAASPSLALQIEKALYAGLRRKWALAGIGAAGLVCVLLVWVWPLADASRTPELRSSVIEAPAPVLQGAAAPRVERAVTAPPSKRAVKKVRPAPKQKSVPQEIFVQLYTDDPNLVIYWFVEPKGVMQ